MTVKKKKHKQQIKTQYGVFTCVFEPESDMGGYAVEAQGIQGAISWGKTLAEAKRMIVEAIECAVEGEAIIRAEEAGLISIRKRPLTLA